MYEVKERAFSPRRELPPTLPYTSKVALRMPDVLKEGVTALSGCLLYEGNSDGTLNARAPTSMNNMLVELLWKGLLAYLPIVDAEIERQARKLEPYRDLATFLMNNPSITAVNPEDLPHTGQAREHLTEMKRQDPSSDWPMTRADVLEEFATGDRLLSQLYVTRNLMAKALEVNPRPRW